MTIRRLLMPLFAGIVLCSSADFSSAAEGNWTRSNRAKYTAQRVGDSIVLIAYGNFPTSGYKAKLRQLPQEIFPPMFECVEQKPGGFTLQVITPFAVIGHFKTPQDVKAVTVYDANGKHTVKVTKRK